MLLVLALGLAAGWKASTPSEVRDRALLTAPIASQTDPVRIVALGSSLTAAYDWPADVEAALADCLERPVEISVVARPGASIVWGVAQTQAVRALAPDIVLVEFAINDADLTDGVPRRESLRLMTELVAALTAEPGPPPAVVLMTMSPASGLRGWLRPTLAAHYRQYHALAETLEIGLIDLFARWMALARSDRGLQADGLHPSPPVAQAVIVPVVTAYLATALQGRACRPPVSSG